MKRKLLVVMLLASTLLISCGNRSVFDSVWTYKKAIITVGDKVIEVEVDKWIDYDTSIQIIAKDGQVYLTDLKNIVLMGE